MFQKNEHEVEVRALKTKHNVEVDSLEKLEPAYSTVKRLKSLLIERKVEGFLGLLIDFIDCEPGFNACVDIAAKSKLFSIIVTNLETAKAILKINDEIKGGVINIYPLSELENLPLKERCYPET